MVIFVKRWTKAPRLEHDDALEMPEATSRKYRLAEMNTCSAADFVERLGGVFEHSPWVPAAVAAERPFGSTADLLGAMVAAVRESPVEKQITLIQAHPDLAGRLGGLTAESGREQAAAGLTAAAPEIVARIQELNSAYRERFGFPFILCVHRNTVATILTAMEQRLHHDTPTEHETALREIARIAQLRLEDLVED
jgi:2-oxo-4-hydroxy-4-carboxy-5-ureidoimidazoline decarboxylase